MDLNKCYTQAHIFLIYTYMDEGNHRYIYELNNGNFFHLTLCISCREQCRNSGEIIHITIEYHTLFARTWGSDTRECTDVDRGCLSSSPKDAGHKDMCNEIYTCIFCTCDIFYI